MDDPSDPLGSFPAADRWPVMLGRYIGLGVLVACSYDWLLSVSDEFTICQKAGFTWSLTAYFLSRCGHAISFTIVLSWLTRGVIIQPRDAGLCINCTSCVL